MRKPRSTAAFIPYDLRPSKQAERRILIDILQASGDIGLPIGNYRYVGMGGNRFYDFILVHKYVGINDMISIEHDKEMYRRAVFSCPYNFIDVLPVTIEDFIAKDTFEKSSVYWFDYDGGINKSIVDDIATLAPKVHLGDLVFVTVCGAPPGGLHNASTRDRLTWFQDEIGAVSGDVTIEDVENASFIHAVHKVLVSTFKTAFTARKDGKFLIMLQVAYVDSIPMITVGGALLTEEQLERAADRLAASMPFLTTDFPQLYNIQSLNLTERERYLFDRAATYKNRRSSDRNQLLKLGFSDSDINTYGELLRYMPRYVETIV